MYHNNPKYNLFFIKDYYLFEYGAIPANVRNSFKLKILIRKGSVEQKNIKLIEYYENIIKTGNFDEKEYAKLNIVLNVSNRMLDCHKARLLKQLRNFYFEWKEFPFECGINRIKRMFNKGMLREARTELMELEKNTLGQEKNIEQKILLFEISEKFFQLYNFTRVLRRTNYYFKKAKTLYNQIILSKADTNIINEIKARFRLLNSHKLTINRFKLKNLKKALSELNSILKIDQNKLPINLQLKIYHRCGLLYNILKDKDKSIKAFTAGKILAEKHKMKAEKMIFESFIMIRNFTSNNNLANKFLIYHKKNFPVILKFHSDVSQILEYELNYLRFLIFTNDPDTEHITNDYLSRQILYSRKADALNSWYLELSDQLSSSVFEWCKVNNRYSVCVNNNILKLFTEMNRISIYKFTNIYSPNVQAILYINIAEQEFWKCTNADFFLAETYVKKLERIMKLYNINISGSWVESSKLGLKIFEALAIQKGDRVYKRFNGSIDRFIEKIKSEKQSFNIASDLAKLLFINNMLKVQELDSKLIELIEWINNNHPNILTNIDENIKK